MSVIDTLTAIASIIRRSLRQHAVSTSITAASVALAVGLVMSVFSLQRQTYDAFTSAGGGFDAVLGARGSPLQLVLNTVFHLETSPGNIPWRLYQRVKQDPRVTLAMPYAVGDNYKGFRIVGTTEDLFTAFEPRPGRKLAVTPGGRAFKADTREAVVGSQTARLTKLRVGDTINPYHGIVYSEKQRHSEKFTVVGILEPTGGPMDNVVWIPIDSLYRMEGHVIHGDGEAHTPEEGVTIPDEHKEISAVMIKFRSPEAGLPLAMMINRLGNAATLAYPVATIVADFFEKVGWASRVLVIVGYLVVAVSVCTIIASLYNTMNERRREFAILRAIGARRSTLFVVIVGEATAIALLGAIAGVVVYAALLAGAAAVIREQTGVVLDVWRIERWVALIPVFMVALGTLSGVVPAIKAYRTDVAANLGPVS